MSNKVQWSESGLQQITDLKKLIVKKKIMLGFMIDDYAWWDRQFRYLHTGLAVIIPLISFTDKMSNGTTERTSVATLMLSSVVAGMIKLKDTLKFGKIVVVAQQQTVKYKQLYQRIEREMNKQANKRETEDSFIYWVGREYNNIEMSDPELTHNMKKKFIALCKDKGIPYDEDMDAMSSLLQDATQELIQIAVQKTTDVVADIVVRDQDIITEEKKLSGATVDTTTVNNTTVDTTTVNNTTINNTAVNNTSGNLIHNKTHTRRASSNLRMRSTSDEMDRTQYKETMKTFNPTEDMQWALDRLSDIQK